MPDECRAVFVYGRLHGVPRARIVDALVKIGGKLVTTPARASLVVLAHEAAGRCIGDAHGLALPFARSDAQPLLSENGFLRRIGLTSTGAQGPTTYALADVARLAGLGDQVCRTLLAFDVIAPEGGALTYPDLATARQVAGLLGRGFPLAAIVAAASLLGRRGLRLSHVRLAAAPWGELVQRFEHGIARLDGQFALVLDEQAGDAGESFAAARDSEESGDLDEAERHYRRAEKLDRADPVIPFNLGNVLAAMGRVPEAAIAYRRALARDPDFAEAAFNLGRLMEGTGQADEALPWYRAALVAHPGYAQALYNAARLLTGRQGFVEALALWERFIALAPSDPDIGHARRLALLCRLRRPA